MSTRADRGIILRLERVGTRRSRWLTATTLGQPCQEVGSAVLAADGFRMDAFLAIGTNPAVPGYGGSQKEAAMLALRRVGLDFFFAIRTPRRGIFAHWLL